MFNPILEHQRLVQEQKHQEQEAIRNAIRMAHEKYAKVEVPKRSFDELSELETCAHDTWEDLFGKTGTRNTETMGQDD